MTDRELNCLLKALALLEQVESEKGDFERAINLIKEAIGG